MEPSDCYRRRIGQIARHLKGTFGILNQACSAARKDGRVFFARQASESYGQFMRPFQAKQVSDEEKNELPRAVRLPDLDHRAIQEKWSSPNRMETKTNADVNSGPIFAKVAADSGASKATAEPAEKQFSSSLPQSSGNRAALPRARSYPDVSSGSGKSLSSNDVARNGMDGSAKSSRSAEEQSSGRLGFEWFPRMDLVESGTAYVITVELPGVSADGIQVEVVRGSLIVTGSRATEWWKSNGNGVNGGGTVFHRRELAHGPYRTVWRLPKNVDVRLEKARDALNLAHAMASLMKTNLDRQTVNILVGLCEHGVNPEALATVVKELRIEAAAMGSRSK
ncbi:hypothetical protein R1sor_011179 [Riccia sorocarpa]|uniref:SHSP domain-containing protein n=1 Tax=Riccia sorocarpa TaxID=122646 RepID=A0ABD3I0I3_9MARC